MIERRPRGRPTRGPKAVGRDKIIESLRAMIRQSDAEDLSRKTLAQYSGVTPALITYYFPNRKALIEAATAPVIEHYYRELQAIIARDTPLAERSRDVIRLLIACHTRDGRILNAYKDLFRESETDLNPNYIALMSKALSTFFDTMIGGEAARTPNSDVLQWAIWGMCEFVARGNLEAHAVKDGKAEGPGPEIDVSRRLFDLITHGLSGWVPGITFDPPDAAGTTKPG